MSKNFSQTPKPAAIVEKLTICRAQKAKLRRIIQRHRSRGLPTKISSCPPGVKKRKVGRPKNQIMHERSQCTVISTPAEIWESSIDRSSRARRGSELRSIRDFKLKLGTFVRLRRARIPHSAEIGALAGVAFIDINVCRPIMTDTSTQTLCR